MFDDDERRNREQRAAEDDGGGQDRAEDGRREDRAHLQDLRRERQRRVTKVVVGLAIVVLLMIFIIATVGLIPSVIAWLPLVIWKFFDVFIIGTIQAFIFMLLTIIYFGQAREGLEEEGHAEHAAPRSAAA